MDARVRSRKQHTKANLTQLSPSLAGVMVLSCWGGMLVTVPQRLSASHHADLEISHGGCCIALAM